MSRNDRWQCVFGNEKAATMTTISREQVGWAKKEGRTGEGELLIYFWGLC